MEISIVSGRQAILFLLILTSVCCSAIAQVLLKTGMSQPTVALAMESGDTFRTVLSALTNLWVLGGLSVYFFGAVVWLFVLAKTEISFAYPFVGLGFILTLILGKLLMGDAVTPTRLLGTLLVSAGVLMIARQ